MASFEQLVFEIIAKDAQASAAFERFRRKVDDASGSVDKNSSALDKNTDALDRNTKSHRSWLGVLVGAGTAFAPITAGAAAAGAGVLAFSALAVPSVKKIGTALTGPGGLAANWDTLDNRQRNAALGIQALGKDYSALARQLEPRVFQVFNEGLTEADSLLRPTGQLARESGLGVADFLATFTKDSGLQQFIRFAATQARPTIDLLGQDVTTLTHTLLTLLHSFAGPGMLELRALSGVFTALDDSITFLDKHAPGLTGAALGITGIAIALSKIGALSGVLKITGISNIASQLTGFTAATKGATLAEKGLLATTTALDAITPWGWVALGITALGGLAYAMTKVDDGSSQVIASLEKQSKASGFNIQGWRDAAAAIGQYNQQLPITERAQGQNARSVAQLSQVSRDYLAAQQQINSGIQQQNRFLDLLQAKYGLTRHQAISLATAAGVLVDKTGHLKGGFQQAAAESEAYANASLRAQRPTTVLTADLQDAANKTLTLTLREKALTDALERYVNPALAADQDTITLKNDQVALAKALQASGGKTGDLTQKQRDAHSAFITYFQQVEQTASDTFSATGRTSDFIRIINAALPVLERAAGHNRTLRQEIQRLREVERSLRTENVAINVTGTGTWSVRGGNTGGAGHPIRPGQPPGTGTAAAGMMVTGGTPGRDSVLISAMPGEVIVPTHMVTAGLVDHLRGMIPGFASGGVVGSYHDGIGGLSKWLKAENSATIRAIADAVAGSFKAARPPISGGFPGGGSSGPGPAAAQAYALSVLPKYGWGLAQMLPLIALWNQESGWRWNATNPTSGAYGIPQSLPADKMAAAGADWRTNPATQIRWGLGYIRDVYGSPAAAEAHELAFHWYDQGGYLPPGLSLAMNGTGKPEPVGAAAGPRIVIENLTITLPPGSPRQHGREIVKSIIAYEGAAGSGWRS